MIRVLHIFAPTFGHIFSGDAKLWARLFQQLTDKEVCHQILFVDRGEIVEAWSIISAFGQKSSTSPARWRRALWAFKLLSLLTIKRRGYDILHVHTDYWGGLLVGPLGKLLGRPTIFQIVRIGGDDPTTLAHESLGFLKLWCFKRFDRVLCISESLRQECLRQGLDAGKVPMLINAVGNNLFSPSMNGHEPESLKRELNLPISARIILSVGSLISRKGADLLMGAFLSLARDYPDLFLVLAGPASRAESATVDEDFVAGLRREISEAGFGERVIFTGRIDDDTTLAKYYRAADLFAFPTRQEGLPNALLEAMSTGLPIVTTYLPGSTDLVIEDGQTGFLIPADNVPALKEKLQWLLDHPAQARGLGEAARLHAVQNFGFDTWQSRLTSIYSSLLDKETAEDREYIEKALP